MRPKHYSAIFLFLFSAYLSAQTDTVRIFFIGNSVTGNGETSRPGEMSTLPKARGIVTFTEQSAYCYTLGHALSQPVVMDRIRNGRWDYVVMQSSFYEYQTELDSFVRCGKILADSIRAAGAVPVTYICWNEAGSTTGKVADASLQLCRAKSIPGVPVNMALRDVALNVPEISLYVDWIHASTIGGYLAGCTFLTAFTGQSPRGLPAMYGITDSGLIRYLQSAAWEAVMADSIKDIRLSWAQPAVVPVRAKLITGDSLTQYFKRQLLIAAKYSDSTSDTSAYGYYKSLDPAILEVKYSGEMTAMTPGTARVVVRYVGKTDTASVVVKASSALLDSIWISPRTFSGMVGNGVTFAVTGHFHEGIYSFDRDVTSGVTWKTDTTVLKIINNAISRVTGRQDTVTVGAAIGPLTDSVTFILEPQLRFLTRIRFQVDTVPFSMGWNADNGAAYSDARGYGWVAAGALASRDDRKGNPLQKSFVIASPEKEYKIKCLDGDYILKMSMGDNIYGGAAVEYIRFGVDTLISHSGASNGINVDTIRVFGNDGIHLFVKGNINYLVAISSEGVDINLVAQDDGSVMGISAQPEKLLAPAEMLSADPTPFAARTSLKFAVQTPGNVSLSIFNASGRKIGTIANGYHAIGGYSANFNASALPAGVYLCRLSVGAKTWSKRIVLLK